MLKKETLTERVNAEIDRWNGELDQLAARFQAGCAEAGAQHDYEAQMTAIRRRRDEAMAKLMQIQSAHDDTWEGLKQGFKRIWTALKKSFKKVTARRNLQDGDGEK